MIFQKSESVLKVPSCGNEKLAVPLQRQNEQITF